MTLNSFCSAGSAENGRSTVDRRGFLRFLGLGAAAAVAAPIIKPKKLWFFGASEMWKPEVVAATADEWVLVRTSLPSFTTLNPNEIWAAHCTTTMIRKSQLEAYKVAYYGPSTT